MKRISTARRQRGSQIVELAIITPVLLLFTLGMVDMAALYRTHQVLNNAAREGARFAILEENKDKTAAVQQVVVSYFNNHMNADSSQRSLTAADVLVDQHQHVPSPSGNFISSSRVTVTYTYNLLYLPRLSSNPAALRLTIVAQFANMGSWS